MDDMSGGMGGEEGEGCQGVVFSCDDGTGQTRKKQQGEDREGK